jgi:hypothetical protein
VDVNGTRFHLIAGEDDWKSVRDATPTGVSSAWHAASASMTLLPDLPLFPRSRRPGGASASLTVDPANRRGAASDRYGTWYWIGNDRQTIWRAPAATTRAVLYWQQGATPDKGQPGAFVAQTPPPATSELGGLTVTTHHYLLVGTAQPPGLLIFDLHAGGEPLRFQFPDGVDFKPFDFAAAPDGGAWLLDADNHQLWGIDRFFRLRPLGPVVVAPPEPGSFEPPAGNLAGFPNPDRAGVTSPLPTIIPADDPLALDVLPDGSLLILDGAPPLGANSSLLHYRLGPDGVTLLPPRVEPLPSLVGVVAEGDARPVAGYDLAVAPGENRVLVLEREGNQAISYGLTFDAAGALDRIEAQAVYLPLHYFGGRGLVAGVMPNEEAAVFYDVTPFPDNDRAVRWIRLHAIDLPRYKHEAWLETPRLDGHQPGVTWHRLFLDACIPPETQVTVWTRAGDDENLLEQQAFVEEPGLYLRGRGAELPYWNAFNPDPDEPLKPGTGTWEVLFQRAHGRWLQVRLVLTGNGRATPRLHRLRAYYPRFSYLRNYLPSAYSDDLLSADFTERLLANMEGFYSDVEGKIAHASALLDPRSAPAEALDWLATWVGLVLDPLWAKVGAPQGGGALTSMALPLQMSGGSVDRRRLMIRFARRLYQRRGTVDGIRFALLLLLDPCLEDTLRRFERATAVPDIALQQELAALGLKYPTAADGEAALEDLLFSYVLASPKRNRVRIVERWQARQGLASQSGDVTATPETPCPPAEDQASAQPVSLAKAIEDASHRFSVLIPEDLPGEEAAMVQKIVDLEKPAHTTYDLRRFWDYFLVGQVRLGIDTVLGEDSRFAPIILGSGALAEGYLESAHPMDVTERTVSDRDRPGQMRL